MKNLFFLAFVLIGTCSFGANSFGIGPIDPPTEKKEKVLQQEETTLYGQPASYSNGEIRCGWSSGRCATIRTQNPNLERIFVTVENETATTFTADLDYRKVVLDEETVYSFSNIEIINE